MYWIHKKVVEIDIKKIKLLKRDIVLHIINSMNNHSIF